VSTETFYKMVLRTSYFFLCCRYARHKKGGIFKKARKTAD